MQVGGLDSLTMGRYYSYNYRTTSTFRWVGCKSLLPPHFIHNLSLHVCSWSQTATPSQTQSQASTASQTPTWFTLTPSPSYVLTDADLAANAISTPTLVGTTVGVTAGQ